MKIRTPVLFFAAGAIVGFVAGFYSVCVRVAKVMDRPYRW